MKMKLKSMGLPATTGELRQAVDRTKSATAYKAAGDGITIPELYIQDSTGVIAGVRLGTQHTVWIPARHLGAVTRIYRDDKLDIGGQEYEVSDILEYFYRAADDSILKSNSEFESHFVLTVTNPND
jgi:hypothetical protein